MRKECFVVLMVLSLSFLEGCVPKPVKPAGPAVPDNGYVTEFSFPDVSTRLESVTHSVSKLFTVAYYSTYRFGAADHYKQYSLSSGDFKSRAATKTVSHETISGTMTLIAHSENRVVFLTCAHILDFPDTVVTFADPSRTLSTDEVTAIAVKERQEIYCRALPGCGRVDILAMDRENDIALVGKECPEPVTGMNPFIYPLGRAKELGWGSAAYVIGFPMGTMMVTKGIVSNPNSDESAGFMMDALFNKGFSGGIILSARSGSSGFELMGMVRSAYSKRDYVLRPEKEIHEYTYSQNVPYTGGIYAATDESINYGVTYVIPAEALRSFYVKNREALLAMGYNLDPFFLSGR
ncbi:MAG: serine protease [Bacteroidetes bacterium]|nr:serine protease [Bacteroidota bacterium]